MPPPPPPAAPPPHCHTFLLQSWDLQVLLAGWPRAFMEEATLLACRFPLKMRLAVGEASGRCCHLKAFPPERPGPELLASLFGFFCGLNFPLREAPERPSQVERSQGRGWLPSVCHEVAGAMGRAVSAEAVSACLCSHRADKTFLLLVRHSPALPCRRSSGALTSSLTAVDGEERKPTQP